jgi:hypothetical protein
MVDPFAKPSKKKRFFKVLKTIFLTKIPMNLLFLLIIIALSIFGFESITSNGKNETPTGYAVLEQECPECVCEEKETDCSLCPVKTNPEEYSGTVEGITLAIDNIELEKDEETTGFVTGVEYTIINKGEFPIVPKIQVKVYEDWTLKAKKAPANKVLSPEIVVSPNDYVKRQDRVRIYFRGEEQTLRLLLIDSLTDPDTEILAVTRDFELD